MSTENLRNLFLQNQESLEDAKKKFSQESRKTTKYLRFNQDGTVAVRILPLAPVINADGEPVMERLGYEYDTKELLLKIKGTDAKGKEKTIMVSVCNAKKRFPKLENDLIDLFVDKVCEKYSDDEALIKKVRSTSFNGGLRYDSKRCMYVLDIDKRGDGLQILKLSFAQYKELEERKLALWEKLRKKDPKAPCPISSIDEAYPLEITRSTENGKTSYSFNIDMLGGDDAALTDAELQALFDAPRLPEVIYRYTRFHLEATIAFLKQYEEQLDIDVLEDDDIKDCIDQIKLSLPSDDNSHFTMNGGDGNDKAGEGATTLDTLWDTYEQITEAGLDDKSEEGQDLRASIMEFIEANGLDIKPSRRDTNQDLLNDIQDIMDEAAEAGEKGGKPAKEAEKPEPEKEKEPEPEPEPEERPARRAREERNDDTNEPAAGRRAGRPARRR